MVLEWESDFCEGDLDGFNPATVDASVGCPECPPVPSDVLAQNVPDSSAPTGCGRALQLVANVKKKVCVFVNAITARSGIFQDDRKWYTYGYFKKVPSDIENLSVNLQRVEDYTEHICLFQWILNPSNPNYGWIMLRTTSGDIRIHYLGDDANWHYFELEGTYQSSPKSRKITRLRIDGSTYTRNDVMPTTPKTWQSSFMVLLETTNKYTECIFENAFKAGTHWSKIGLVKL